MPNKRLESNIWKYTIQLATNKRIFISFLSVYYLTIPNVTIQSVGLIAGIGTFFGFLFELPSGYIADKIGHKQALVLSNFLLVLSSLSFYLSNSFYMLILGAVLLSIGNAFSSGTGTAFMHETISALGRDKDYVRIMGKVRSIGFAGPAIITALIPFLIVYGYKTPFLIAIIIDTIGLISVLSLIAPDVKAMKVESAELGPNNFLRAFREIRHYDLLPGMLFAAVSSALMFAIAPYRGTYQESLGIAVIWFGLLHSAGRWLASVLLWFSGRLHSKIPGAQVRLVKIVLYGTLTCSLWFFENIFIVATIFILLNGFHWGLNGLGGGTHKKLKASSLKATILSVKAQIQNILIAIVVPTFGFLIMHVGYKNAFLVLGLSFMVVSFGVHHRMSKNGTAGDDDSDGE